MGKVGRPRKGAEPVVKVGEERVSLYVMPRQRARLNWLARRRGVSQSDALAAMMDVLGVPPDAQPEQVQS